MAGNKENKKFSAFNAFYRSRKEKKDLEPEPPRKMNFLNFFMTLPRRFGKLVSFNLLVLFCNFPLIFPLLASTGYFSTAQTAPAYDTFSAVYNLVKHQPSPSVSTLWGIFGIQIETHIPNTTTTVLYCLGFISLILLGPVCTGCAYISRNLARGESVSVVSDFFYAIKKNLRQGFTLGLIDALLSIMLVWDAVFFYGNSDSGMMTAMFVLSLCMILVYFFMRFYMYQILVTFKLSTFKILKNSLIFAFLGIWRNILATIGIALIVLTVYTLLGLFVPLAVAVVVICGASMCIYMASYAAYPKIKEYMIDPYYTEDKKSYFDEREDETSDSDGEETVNAE